MTRAQWVCSVALILGSTAAYAAAPEIRLTPAEVGDLLGHSAGAGTSGVSGIQTMVLAGDPSRSGPYTIRLRVPARTRIAAHSHRDDRTAVVISGTWFFGYGRTANRSALKPLPPGSFYSEPGGVAHFAETRNEAVVVYITGNGPTDTVYVNPVDDPRRK